MKMDIYHALCYLYICVFICKSKYNNLKMNISPALCCLHLLILPGFGEKQLQADVLTHFFKGDSNTNLPQPNFKARPKNVSRIKVTDALKDYIDIFLHKRTTIRQHVGLRDRTTKRPTSKEHDMLGITKRMLPRPRGRAQNGKTRIKQMIGQLGLDYSTPQVTHTLANMTSDKATASFLGQLKNQHFWNNLKQKRTSNDKVTHAGTGCIDKCAILRNVCKNGATCVNTCTGFTCVCVSGYSGYFCEKNTSLV